MTLKAPFTLATLSPFVTYTKMCKLKCIAVEKQGEKHCFGFLALSPLILVRFEKFQNTQLPESILHIFEWEIINNPSRIIHKMKRHYCNISAKGLTILNVNLLLISFFFHFISCGVNVFLVMTTHAAWQLDFDYSPSDIFVEVKVGMLFLSS